jgi:membrane protease YdiL (CAAX protease family)
MGGAVMLQRASLFLLILALGLFVFVVLSHFRPLLPKPADLPVRIATAAVLLAAALLARRSERFRTYWQVLFALFIGIVAISIDYFMLLGQRVLGWAGIDPNTPAGWAIDKLGGSLTVIVVVVALTLAAGSNLASLRIKKGRLGLGLAVGLGTFAIAAATAIPLAGFMFGGKDLSLARVLPWTPWILVFVLANAAGEEILFRGLFLGRLEPVLGRFPSNLIAALPFLLMHYGVPYTTQQLMFLVALLPLALAWGWLMQKTDSIWGSVLFHAGMDISVMVGMFSNLPAAG